MKLTWIGHACFIIENAGYSLVIDPYKPGSVPGLSDVNETANEVLCTHGHGDHNGAECVELVATDAQPIKVTKLATYHDHHEGQRRGLNDMYIFEADGVRAAHLGDLGCALTAEQAETLKNLDVLMIPVGGFFTIDAEEAAGIVKQLAPKKVVPMHFRSDEKGFGYDVIGPVEAFIEKMDDVVLAEGSVLDLDAAPDAQVVVLKPKNL